MADLERFDELAKGLATNRLSRVQVLKSFAAGVLLAGPLGALWNSPASAQQPGTCSVASRCPNKEYCSADQGCVCVQSAEGDIRCGKIPTSCNVKLCQTSADCADLGAGYFCDTPNSGCCTDPPAEQTRCIAPCTATTPSCPPERVCGTECCPEGQSCINGACSEETPVPCADDPVTAASLDAAGSALAAGAREVNLSPNGCVRYHRTLTGGSVTSEEVTVEGKPALVWKHTPTRSTGRRDADLDGYFEWRSTVQRGAATMKDDRTVTTEYSAATRKPTRRETYTRGTGKGWHVLIQEADQSGTLVTVDEFDTGPQIAASAPRDRGSGGDLPNDEYRVAAHKANTGVNGLTTSGCKPSQTKILKATLKESRDQGLECMQTYGALDIALPLVIDYVARPIVITCGTPSPKNAWAGINVDSATMVDHTVRITVNNDPMNRSYFFNLSGDQQAATLWHEMLHNDFGAHAKKQTIETDRTWACEDLCFGISNRVDTAGKPIKEPPTKCSCDKCLGTPPGQKCNAQCLNFNTCKSSAGKKRCACPPAGCPSNQPPGNPPGNKIYCFCNNTCYNTATDCTSQCKATLACFTGICEPAAPGQC